MEFESHDPYQGPRWWKEAVSDGVPLRPQGRQTSDKTTFDVIVVGGGASAHFVSLFLNELGVSTVMLEAGAEGGGTAYKSAAGMWFPDNTLMRGRGLEPDQDWALHHMAKLAYPDVYDPEAPRLGLGNREYELVTVYYATSRQAADELARVGLRLMEFPSITGKYDAMVEYHSDTKGFGTHLAISKADGSWGAGVHLMDEMARLACAADIDLRVRHRVTEVEANHNGEVVGVVAETPDGHVRFQARRAVVFATGGYAHNPDLMTKHFSTRMFGSCAVPTAQGDFVAVAESIGADIGNMGCGWGTEHPLEMMLDNREVGEHIGVFPGDSILMVNASGVRVVNEKEIYHERSQIHYQRDENGALPNHLLFLIYDDWAAYQPADQPNRWPSPEPDQPWVMSSATLDGLADVIDARLKSYGDRIDNVRLEPDFKEQVRRTIERFNTFARQGVDEDFHRGEADVELDWTGPSHVDNDKNPTMYPLADGPYHAIMVAGSILDTNGGPKASPDGKILNLEGDPIPGLYGVGNCVASAAGEGYWSGGSTLGPAAIFSYLAAQSIAREPVRSITATTGSTA